MFDREKLEMVRLNQSKPFVDDAPGQLFFHLLLDKDEILWLASTDNGVYRVNFPKKQFQVLKEVSPVPVGDENLIPGIRGYALCIRQRMAISGQEPVGRPFIALIVTDR